jgi:alcohol dehydrogenase
MSNTTIPFEKVRSHGDAARNKIKTKGLVYGGPDKIEYKDISKPRTEKMTDAMVKIIKTTICGSDLDILHRKTPRVKPGTTLGHEGVGVIVDVGITCYDWFFCTKKLSLQQVNNPPKIKH